MNEELLEVLQKMLEELNRIGNSVSALSNLIEDGYARPVIECGKCQSKRK
jgi:hypothetical protein